MKYPSHEVYAQIYSRFLLKGPEIFFEKCSPKGLTIADLCSGGGIVTRYALAQGAKFVVMVEQCGSMMPNDIGIHPQTSWIGRNVEYFFQSMDIHPFDMLTCRQGVNYWLKNVNGEDIAKKLVSGGMFVFNTFGNKPPDRPKVREYFHGGRAYCEVSYCVGDVVHHVQMCDGFEPHFTSFDWLPDELIQEKLNPYFNLEKGTDGPSNMWYCTKK